MKISKQNDRSVSKCPSCKEKYLEKNDIIENCWKCGYILELKK